MIHHMFAKPFNPHVMQDVLGNDGRPDPGWSSRIEYAEGTFDGGSGFATLGFRSGIRFDPATLPNRIRFRCAPRVRPLPDVLPQAPEFFSTRVFRDLVEAMEPGQHQFHPIAVTWKDGTPAEDRWIVHPTRRIDTADRERTTLVMRTNPVKGWSWWDDPAREDKSLPPGRFAIDRAKVAGRHIWQDMYLLHQVQFVSSAFRKACEDAGISGIGFKALDEIDLFI